MAITSVHPFPMPPPTLFWSFTQLTLNASGDKAAVIVQAPKDGTLHSFEWRVGSAVLNNPDNGVRMSFQDVNLVTGNPDGTQDQYFDHTDALSAGTWITPSGPLTDDGTSGGVKRTVSQGDYVACVLEFVSFAASDSFTVSAWNYSTNGIVFPNFYGSDGSSGSYSKSSNSVMVIALKYDDGTYAEFPFNFVPAANINSYTGVQSTSSPDEYALRFQVPASIRVKGAWMLIDSDNDVNVNLYNSGGTSLASASLDAQQRTDTGASPKLFIFDTSVTLSANTTYYLGAISASTAIAFASVEAPTAGHMAAFPGQSEWYMATRTDAGSWTETTDEWLIAGLIVDGIDDGAGSGGGGGSFTFVG